MPKKTPNDWKRKESFDTRHKEKCAVCRKLFRRDKMFFAVSPLWFLGGGGIDPADKEWMCGECHVNLEEEV